MFHMGQVFVFAMGFDLLLNVAENISNNRTNSLCGTVGSLVSFSAVQSKVCKCCTACKASGCCHGVLVQDSA